MVKWAMVMVHRKMQHNKTNELNSSYVIHLYLHCMSWADRE